MHNNKEFIIFYAKCKFEDKNINIMHLREKAIELQLDESSIEEIINNRDIIHKKFIEEIIELVEKKSFYEIDYKMKIKEMNKLKNFIKKSKMYDEEVNYIFEDLVKSDDRYKGIYNAFKDINLKNEYRTFSKVINLVSKIYFIVGMIVSFIWGEGHITDILKFLLINGGLLSFIIWKRDKLPMMRHQANKCLKFAIGSMYLFVGTIMVSQILYNYMEDRIEFYNLDKNRPKISIVKDLYACEDENANYIELLNSKLNQDEFIDEINELASNDIELWKKDVAISTVDQSIYNDINLNKDYIFEDKNLKILDNLIKSVKMKQKFVYSDKLSNTNILEHLEDSREIISIINKLEEQLGDFDPNKKPFDINKLEYITAYVNYEIKSNNEIVNTVKDIVGDLADDTGKVYYITDGFLSNVFEGALKLKSGEYFTNSGMYNFNVIQSGEMEVEDQRGFKRSIPVYYKISDEDMNWYYENEEKIYIYEELQIKKDELNELQKKIDNKLT